MSIQFINSCLKWLLANLNTRCNRMDTFVQHSCTVMHIRSALHNSLSRPNIKAIPCSYFCFSIAFYMSHFKHHSVNFYPWSPLEHWASWIFLLTCNIRVSHKMAIFIFTPPTWSAMTTFCLLNSWLKPGLRDFLQKNQLAFLFNLFFYKQWI